MKPMTKTLVGATAMTVAMALGGPSYAHWGAPGPFATYSANAYCSHADANNTNVRRARVRLILNWGSTTPEPELGQPPVYYYWDTVEIKNVSASGRIDAFWAYYNHVWTSGYSNDINVGVTRIVTSGDTWQGNFTQARCQVTNG